MSGHSMKRIGIGFVGLWTLLVISGCKSPPKGPPPPSEYPKYSELAAAHNARLQMLQTVYASGVVELRWGDKKGHHTEQGNVELWLKAPRRTALRIEKLGENLAWLGCDGTQSWLFDLTNDDRILRVGPNNLLVTDEDRGAVSVTPSALLDLIAFTPLPMEEPQPAVQFDAGLDAWMISSRGLDAPIRVYFDRTSHLPKKVESLSTDGSGVVFFSDLRNFQSVKVPGVSVAALPKMPCVMELGSPTTGDANSDIREGQVKIVINDATTEVDPEQMKRVFNLEMLINALRPNRIERTTP